MLDPNLPSSPDDYSGITEYLASPDIHPDDKAHLFRITAERDFWFFMRYAMRIGREYICAAEGCQFHGTPIYDHPWVFERCREVQAEPDNYLDLWPRFHLKTSTITIGLTLWDFIPTPSTTMVIITWKIEEVGESFVEGLRLEMERNEVLSHHWPEVFWHKPERESPVWKRGQLNLKQHPGIREPSISMQSLNAMRTSKHYPVIVYDDIVTEESARTPDACEDCTEKFKKTAGMRHDNTRVRGVGTRWASNDTYRYILDRGVLKRRVGPEDCYGQDGQSVLHPGSRWLDAWRAQMGEALFFANLRNRCIDEQSMMRFKIEWLTGRYYTDEPEDVAEGCNLYGFVDPARLNTASTSRSDYVGIVVLALHASGRRYVVEMIRDKMEAGALADRLFKIDRYWRKQENQILKWWWECRGAAFDLEWLRGESEKRHHPLEIFPYNDNTNKDVRILRLREAFERGDIRLPARLYREVEGSSRDMVQVFVQHEYMRWKPRDGSSWRPAIGARNDDLLDTLAQHQSPKVKAILQYPIAEVEYDWNAMAQAEDLKRQRRKRRPGRGESPWAC